MQPCNKESQVPDLLPHNVTLCGDGALKERISLKRGHLDRSQPSIACILMRRGHLDTERVNLKWLREETTACILVGVVGEL